MSLVVYHSGEYLDHNKRLKMPEPGLIDRVALITHHWLWQAVDLLFPSECIHCSKEGERWCPECRALIERVGSRICLKCGKRLKKGTICQDCTANPPHYEALRSFGLYRDPLRKAILRAKYHRDLGLGEILADFMLQLLIEQEWEPDLIVPVPMSRSKLDERGYNQVDLFAHPLAWKLGLPYQDRVLIRLYEDTSQVKLTADSRRLNVAHSFRVEWPDPIQNRTVLLIDDVATTGSTAEVCTNALLAAGASQVFVATLARSLLRKSNQEVI
jgi:competence protein ComFC